MLSCAIDAKENRYVIVSDIPGAFLHADMDDNVHMLLEGTVAEMIVKVDPTIYRKHIWNNKHGKPCNMYSFKSHTWNFTSSTTPQEARKGHIISTYVISATDRIKKGEVKVAYCPLQAC